MRILIVTRHFPPIVSGGARRPYLLARGLGCLGAEVTVLAPAEGAALPDNIKLITAPHPMPAPDGAEAVSKKFDVKKWVRTNLFLPDPDLRWSLQAAGVAKRKIANSPDWIFSTSPCESIHMAAAMLARHFSCKWAADFRDNWLVDPLLAERRYTLRRKAETLLARALLKNADLICAPTTRILSEIKYYAEQAPALLLRQPGRLEISSPPVRRSAEQETITLVHTGSFSLSHDARSIDQALTFFTEAHKREPRLRLKLIGRLTDAEQAAARAHPNVQVAGLLAIEETWAAQATADILLLVVAAGSDIVPGKLAEYQAAGKPIICLGGGAWSKELMEGEDPQIAIARLRDAAARRALAEKQCGVPVYADEVAAELLAEMSAISGER